MSAQASRAVPVLEARGIGKRFGQVTALEATDFVVYPGEVSTLLGDNGAGKSTLIKILSGALQPDEGEILMDGKPVHFTSPMDARKAGIETVYQNLAVAPALDPAANLFLGRELVQENWFGRLFGVLDNKAMYDRTMAELNKLRVNLRGNFGPIEHFSGGQRQAVAVARAVAWARRLVIMDEPTAALGVKETNMVLELIETVREQGIAVVLINHSMPQVFQVADRINVMRLGRRVANLRRSETTMEDVVSLMTGLKIQSAQALSNP